MVAFLQRQGFAVVRVRGSHHILRKAQLRTTVPVHGTQALKIGTLAAILRDVEMSPIEFTRMWESGE